MIVQSILYTLPNCPHCQEAREALDSQEPWREILIDNPVAEAGMRALIGRVMAPVLLRPTGEFHFLVEISPGVKRFVRLLV